eukprot:2595371-Rhodomonas_salina.1
MNFNEMVAASCFENYDSKRDINTKNVLVTKLAKSLAHIVKNKKIFPDHNRPVWVLKVHDLPRVVEILTVHCRRFRNKGNVSRKQGGFVYAAYSQGNGVKVGMTQQKDPWDRVKSFNAYVRNPYKIIGLIQCGNPFEVEAFMHSRLQRFRVGVHNQELFDVEPSDVQKMFFVARMGIQAMGLNCDDCVHTERLEAYFK